MKDTTKTPELTGLLNRILRGTLHHYSTRLPERPGWFSGFLLRRLFSGIRMDDQQLRILRDLPDDAMVAFVNKNRSIFDYLFCHTQLKDRRLPHPSFGFNYRLFFIQPLMELLRIPLAHLVYRFRFGKWPDPYSNGYYEEQLRDGTGAMISLVQEHEFVRRFVKSGADPLRFLLELQGRTDRPVVIVPFLLFFGKSPVPSRPTMRDILFGPEQKPGLLRRLSTLFRRSDKTFFELSRPVVLNDYLTALKHPDRDLEYQALMLRRDLLHQINQHRRSIIGPIKKSHIELKHDILTGERLQPFMTKYARRRKISLSKARQEAMGYIDEMAARFTPAMVQAGLWGVAWLRRNMFDGLSFNREMLGPMKEASLKGPLVFLPCHRSHMDSLLVSTLLYEHNFSAPLIFAGKNMGFWPLGPIFRRLGAFFVRRSFKGAVFYAKVLSEYIFWILKEGHHVEVFIEGTRSRSGKLMAPQLGMLSMLLNAVRAGACEDLSFVPVYVGYDRVPEETAYLSESEGGKKIPESFRSLFGARKKLRHRYGRIYVRFSEPLPISELMEVEPKARIQDTSTKEVNQLTRRLSHRIMYDIERETVVTPHALAACALLAPGRPLVSRKRLDMAVETYLSLLTVRDSVLADTLTVDPERAIATALTDYENRKLIEPSSKAGSKLDSQGGYRIRSQKRAALSYYKNNCINRFVPAAITALLIMQKESFQFSTEDLHRDFDYLADLFSLEFTFPADQPPAFIVRKTVKAFIDDAILMPHPTLPDTYRLTATGYRKLIAFAGLLRPFLECYWVVLNHLKKRKKSGMAVKRSIRKIRSLGSHMYRKRQIECREALLEPNFVNALEYFTKAGIRSREDAELIDDTEKRLTAYLQLFQS